MSNSQFRDGKDLLREIRRRQLINAAAQRLYLQRGGRALEKLIAIVDDTLDGAKRCREDDSRRLRENPKVTWREKGERPLITVAEQRLHVNLMLRYLDRREDLKLQVKLEINEAISAAEPVNDDELRTLLDGFFSTLGREQGSSPEPARDLVPECD